MTLASSTPELSAAAERFRGFFTELGRTFVERDDLLAQVALALLSREHVLMTGPPGTAKSGIAASVLGRIVDERTGKPSVFARQFTESTVQTDLVGPIDFKTLMQTGRTEHFTDEGMLGAVHAFLDEVLDGRDMLLRTTLNVLHERELKQGTKTTSGQIECALMTTNRYLAEVLEGSRETLLAFVDRIAFVSFVPKGFCEPASLGRVVRSQIGGARPRAFASLLTIQDLDVLQAAADRVVVPDEICSALCTLCEHLDADLATAAKHDPTFQPTRYLSTRTAVRLGRILRAVCVYDAVMNGTPRSFEVERDDLAMLRLSLLLSGPDHGKLGRLLERETDPRERRQLSILRTEREIFDRALARVPRTARRPAKQAPDLGALEREVERAIAVREPGPGGYEDPGALIQTAAKLAAVSDGGGAGALEAASLLDTTLAHLAERALRIGTTAGAGPDAGSTDDVVAELADLADGLEKASGSTRPVARWLRGRAIRILLDAAALSSADVGASLDARADDASSLAGAATRAARGIARLERMLGTCATLRAAGAEEPAADTFDRAIGVAVVRVEDELVEIWDAAFRDSVARALGRLGPEQLGVLLAALGPALADIDEVGARLAKLGGRADSLKARVVAPRIEPLVRAAFERVDTGERVELVAAVGTLVEHLRESGLQNVIPKATVLRFAVAALARSEKKLSPRGPAARPDFAAYRELRASEQRVSLAYTTIELALRIAPDKPVATGAAEELVGGVSSFIGALPDDLRREIVELDLARIVRAVSLVEAWWRVLAKDADAAAAEATAARVESAVEALAASKFFHVTRDEGALLRFALECRIVGEVFPDAGERVAAVRTRIDAVEADSSRALGALRRGRADAAWTELLGPTSQRPARP
ncbi:MAG: AAA family ATPase [Labilithrix sp.]|nr:AAA family ATPase [Labilithrix sp.]